MSFEVSECKPLAGGVVRCEPDPLFVMAEVPVSDIVGGVEAVMGWMAGPPSLVISSAPLLSSTRQESMFHSPCATPLDVVTIVFITSNETLQ